MNKIDKIDKEIMEILSLALELKRKNIDVLIKYSPHVFSIEVKIYINGWRHLNNYDELHCFFLAEVLGAELPYEESLKYIIDKLKKLLK